MDSRLNADKSDMGSVGSPNPGLSTLFQTLSNVNSPVLSSPNAMAALEKASPADIVELSVSATQLQDVNLLFGSSGSPAETDVADLSSTFADLEASLTGSDTASTGDANNVALNAAKYQSALQTSEMDALFGSDSGGSSSDSGLSMIG